MSDSYTIDEQGRVVFEKDPHEVYDYTLDATSTLTSINDTIAAVTVSVDTVSGLVMQSRAFNPYKVTAWIAGGVLGRLGSVTFSLTTVGGRLIERSIYMKIKQK